MFAPDEKAKLGEAPPKPEGAEWAPPLEVITDLTYRADGAGYLKPGYTHIYVVSADGGAPRQLTFGALQRTRPALLGAGRQRHLFATGNRTENWRREPVNTELYEVSRRRRLDQGAHASRTGPDTRRRVSPDGKTHRVSRFRRQAARLSERASCT